MPRFTDQAVCIRHWDFSETSQTVSLFSKTHGLIRGLAKGSKREKSRFSGGIELLTLGHITAISKQSTDLATLTEWDLAELFPALRKNLKAYYAGLYFADLLHHLISENDPHEQLFDTLIAILRALDDPPPVRENAQYENTQYTAETTTETVVPESTIGICLLAFQWAILCETGYQPVLDRDIEHNTPIDTGGNTQREKRTLAFSASAGGVVADTGEQDRWRVRAETINLLRDVQQIRDQTTDDNNDTPQDSSPETSNNFIANCIAITAKENITSTTTDRANRLLAAYLRTILDRELPTMRFILGNIPK